MCRSSTVLGNAFIISTFMLCCRTCFSYETLIKSGLWPKTKWVKIINIPKCCCVGESGPAHLYTGSNWRIFDTRKPVLENAHEHTGKHWYFLKFDFCLEACPEAQKQNCWALEIVSTSDNVFGRKMLILWKVIVDTSVSIS